MNCCLIDGGRDHSITLEWTGADCINCSTVCDTPTFTVTPADDAVEAVTFYPASPFYLHTYPLPVILECPTAGASIYYTDDNSEPTNASTPYSGPIILSVGKIIKAIAYKTGLTHSPVSVGVFTATNNRGIYTKITSTAVLAGTGEQLFADYVFLLIGSGSSGSSVYNPWILEFTEHPPSGSQRIRHIMQPVTYPPPTGFYEDSDTVVPITLLGPSDGFDQVDANGNPFARFTWGGVTDLNWRHYACVATNGATYGFNVKLTF